MYQAGVGRCHRVSLCTEARQGIYAVNRKLTRSSILKAQSLFSRRRELTLAEADGDQHVTRSQKRQKSRRWCNVRVCVDVRRGLCNDISGRLMPSKWAQYGPRVRNRRSRLNTRRNGPADMANSNQIQKKLEKTGKRQRN